MNVVAGLALLVLGLSPLTQSDSAPAPNDSYFDEESVVVNGTSDGSLVFEFPKVEGVKDVFIYSYKPICSMDKSDAELSTCQGLSRQCDASDAQSVLWSRLDTRAPEANWQRLEQDCLIPGETPERPGDVVIAVTEKQLRELPIAAPALGSQPGRHTLKGAETNIYAEPADQSFTIDILGRRVDVRVKPSEYRWDYGDGTTLVTGAPGGPIPESRWGEKTVTSHAYRQTGDFAVNLTTVFTGEFSVDGGPFQPIVGSAPIPSAPRTLSVWRSEVKLYADDCNVNPQGAGCQ